MIPPIQQLLRRVFGSGLRPIGFHNLNYSTIARHLMPYCVVVAALFFITSQCYSQEVKKPLFRTVAKETTVKTYALELTNTDITYTGEANFTVIISDSYKVGDIVSVSVFVDTDGLYFEKNDCNTSSSACMDHLQFVDVEKWDVEYDFGLGAQRTNPGNDYQENRYYGGNQNMGYFDKAKQAVASGVVNLTVEPSKGNDFKVHAVWVKVEYETNGQKRKNRSK